MLLQQIEGPIVFFPYGPHYTDHHRIPNKTYE
jgi:hypothetical protein